MADITSFHLKQIHEYELVACPPYSFELTAHKPRYGYLFSRLESYENGVVWSGIRLNDGNIVGIRARSLGTIWHPKIVVTVFGCQKLLAEYEVTIACEVVERVLGTREDISEFYDLAEKHLVLQQAKADLFGMRDSPFPDLFSGIILTLLLHRAPWQRSLKMLSFLYSKYGTTVMFDDHKVTVVPAIQQIVESSENELRTQCHLGYRSRVLKLAASYLSQNWSRFKDLDQLDPAEAVDRLMDIPGVGQYSAEILSPHPAFPVDSWSAKVFGQFFGLETLGGFKEMATTVKKYASETFGRWQSYAYCYILHDLENLAKKFGVEY